LSLSKHYQCARGTWQESCGIPGSFQDKLFKY